LGRKWQRLFLGGTNVIIEVDLLFLFIEVVFFVGVNPPVLKGRGLNNPEFS